MDPIVKRNKLSSIIISLLFLLASVTALSQTTSQGGVFVLGGIHQSHERAKTYTYSRMGEIYRELKPDILLVETQPKYVLDKSFKGTPFDFIKFMIPLAQKDSTPIYGIDWWDNTKGEEWIQRQKDFFHDTTYSSEIELLGNLFSMLNNYFVEKDFAEINSTLITNIWKAKNEFKYSLMEQSLTYKTIAAYEKERNKNIAANILEIVRRYPDKKILIAIGIDHKYFIEDRLKENGIKVYQTDEIEEFKKH